VLFFNFHKKKYTRKKVNEMDCLVYGFAITHCTDHYNIP